MDLVHTNQHAGGAFRDVFDEDPFSPEHEQAIQRGLVRTREQRIAGLGNAGFARVQ